MTPGDKIILGAGRWRAGVLAAVLGCTMAGPALATPTDAWITTRTKLALLTTEGVSSRAVSVDTSKRRVTLHGKVHSGEEKMKAESVAKAIENVQGVVNLLEVVAPQHEKAVRGGGGPGAVDAGCLCGAGRSAYR